jgi:uncharacterized membrane protein
MPVSGSTQTQAGSSPTQENTDLTSKFARPSIATSMLTASATGIGTFYKTKTDVAVIASSILGGLIVLSLVIALVWYRQRQRANSRVAPSAEVSKRFTASTAYVSLYLNLPYVSSLNAVWVMSLLCNPAL